MRIEREEREEKRKKGAREETLVLGSESKCGSGGRDWFRRQAPRPSEVKSDRDREERQKEETHERNKKGGVKRVLK